MKNTERERLFRQCATDHLGIVTRIARSFAPDAAVEDLSQEIWLSVWQALPRFAARSKLSTWLYQVALRTAMTWKRGQRPLSEMREAQPEPQEAAQVHTNEHDTATVLRDALQHFNPVDRSLLLLLLEGLSYREIGEVLGIRESNVGVRLSRLKAKLKTLLAPLHHELR